MLILKKFLVQTEKLAKIYNQKANKKIVKANPAIYSLMKTVTVAQTAVEIAVRKSAYVPGETGVGKSAF